MANIKFFFEKANRHFWQYIYLYTGLEFVCRGFSLKKYFKLRSDLNQIKQQACKSELKFPVTKLRACYSDLNSGAGELPFHYFYQDLYIAQRIFLNNPVSHIDIGSRIDGLVAHVASFRKIEVYDIRPLPYKIANVVFVQKDLMTSNQIESADSI